MHYTRFAFYSLYIDEPVLAARVWLEYSKYIGRFGQTFNVQTEVDGPRPFVYWGSIGSRWSSLAVEYSSITQTIVRRAMSWSRKFLEEEAGLPRKISKAPMRVPSTEHGVDRFAPPNVRHYRLYTDSPSAATCVNSTHRVPSFELFSSLLIDPRHSTPTDPFNLS